VQAVASGVVIVIGLSNVLMLCGPSPGLPSACAGVFPDLQATAAGGGGAADVAGF
jgi:hypothetical protein